MSDVAPNENSVLIMSAIDRMPAAFRELVREFGFAIVSEMMAEGYDNAAELRDVLVGWRERRQEQWLSTDYVTRRSARSIADALVYRHALQRTA